MIIVLDTNVLVSGLIAPGNPPGRVIDMLRAGEVTLAIDDRIFAEYSEVLSREFFRRYFSEQEKRLILDFIAHDSLRVLCAGVAPGLPDPDDACFLEVAIGAGAPLLTGNLKHFPKEARAGAKVITPAEFVAGWGA